VCTRVLGVDFPNVGTHVAVAFIGSVVQRSPSTTTRGSWGRLGDLPRPKGRAAPLARRAVFFWYYSRRDTSPGDISALGPKNPQRIVETSKPDDRGFLPYQQYGVRRFPIFFRPARGFCS